MNTSEVLNRAADLIEERGWTTGSGWVVEGMEDAKLCLEGGIMAALGLAMPEQTQQEQAQDPERYDALGELWACPSYLAVADYLGRDVSMAENDRPADALYWWNDNQKDAAVVIATLRAVALIEAAKENTTTAAPESVPA